MYLDQDIPILPSPKTHPIQEFLQGKLRPRNARPPQAKPRTSQSYSNWPETETVEGVLGISHQLDWKINRFPIALLPYKSKEGGERHKKVLKFIFLLLFNASCGNLNRHHRKIFGDHVVNPLTQTIKKGKGICNTLNGYFNEEHDETCPIVNHHRTIKGEEKTRHTQQHTSYTQHYVYWLALV